MCVFHLPLNSPQFPTSSPAPQEAAILTWLLVPQALCSWVSLFSHSQGIAFFGLLSPNWDFTSRAFTLRYSLSQGFFRTKVQDCWFFSQLAQFCWRTVAASHGRHSITFSTLFQFMMHSLKEEQKQSHSYKQEQSHSYAGCEFGGADTSQPPLPGTELLLHTTQRAGNGHTPLLTGFMAKMQSWRAVNGLDKCKPLIHPFYRNITRLPPVENNSTRATHMSLFQKAVETKLFTRRVLA